MVALSIDSAVLTPYRLGIAPETGFGPHREGYILTLTGHDGAKLSGDVAPLPGFSRETFAEVADEWNRVASGLHQSELPSFTFGPDERLDEFLESIHCASLRFGLEQALLGLTAHQLGMDLRVALLDEPCDAITTAALVTSEGASDTAVARRLVDEGYQTLKIKVGRLTVDEDVERIAAIRNVVGSDVKIRVDANRSWTFADAVSFVDRTSRIGFEFIEEPLADASQLLEFWEATGASIGLDEALLGASSDELDRWAFVSHFVLKPTLMGGIRSTELVVRKARSFGIRPVVSASFESGLGIAFLALLAGRWSPDGPAAGLGTHRYLRSDTTTRPFQIGPVVHLADVSPESIHSS